MSMMRALWNRLLARRKADGKERRDEYERRSPGERRFVDESVEDRTGDAVEEHFGGSDPQRLIDNEKLPRD